MWAIVLWLLVDLGMSHEELGSDMGEAVADLVDFRMPHKQMRIVLSWQRMDCDEKSAGTRLKFQGLFK